MKIETMGLYIFPLDDLHCGYGIQQGSIMPSLPYIPGRVVRGGLAGWAIRTGRVSGPDNATFRLLFLPEAGETSVSFPFCTPNGDYFAPLSLFELKGGGNNPRTRLVTEPDKPYTESDVDIEIRVNDNALLGPVDFLRRSIWPSDLDTTFKPCKGTLDYETMSVKPAFSTKIDLKAAHDESKGRVKEQEGLFAVEAMPTSVSNKRIFYRGTLVFEAKPEISDLFSGLVEQNFDPARKDREALETVGPDHLIFIGRRKVAAAVFATSAETIDSDKDEFDPIARIEKDKELTISLMSDCIPPQGSSTKNRGNVFTNILSGFELTKKRAFCQTGQVHGWDLQVRQMASEKTLTAGSCVFFKANLTQEYLKKLRTLSLFGMGKHRRDGFGRFIINWDLHNILSNE